MILLRLLSVCVLATILGVAVWPPRPAAAYNLMRYNDLRNEYVKVTDVAERQRTEDRYVPTNGKVTLQKVPYKEVVVTAELRQKPPSSMDTMFTSQASPMLKICLSRFDTADKPLEDECKAFQFESMVKGNVGTAIFRLTDDTARYALKLPKKASEKGSAIKLWYPTDD